MFGLLKKKLQEAINKITGKAGPEEEIKQDVSVAVVEKIEEKIEKLQELEEKIEEEKLPPAVAESVAEEKVAYEEVKKELEEKISKEKKEEKHVSILVKEKEERPGFLTGLIRRVTEKKLDEAELDKFLRDLQILLLENDVALETAERICDDVKKELSGKSVKRGEVEVSIKNALRYAMLDVMQQPGVDLEQLIEKKYNEMKKPFLIVFFGFNGSGKTTTIAKLAYKLKKHKPVIAAGDTFRAASIEQLEQHGQRLGVEVVKHKYGADSAAVIFDAVKHASAVGSKVVLADTAGRSHSNINLMDELKKIVRVNNPDLKVLILDAITGNDIYDQSRLFNDAAGVDAIILTKTDVYEKGGAALSATHTIKKPVLFLGIGQNYEDLKEFDAEFIVKNLLE